MRFSAWLRLDTTLYLENCKPRLLHPASTLQTFIPRKFLRDLRCCSNSYREMQSVHRKAPHITVGASRFHPLIVNPVGAIQNQHAREWSPPTKEGKWPRNEKDEGEGEDEKSPGTCLRNKPTRTSWHCDSCIRALPFVSFLHLELLHS